MRLSTFSTGAAALAILGFLGFRLRDVEQRVAALVTRLGETGPRSTSLAPTAKRDGGPPPNARGFEQRLSALERQVEALSRLDFVSKPANVTGSVAKEEAILSVVERETSRIRDVQLEWQRARWLEAREQQVTVLAAQLKLERRQTTELYRALEHEADAMVGVLKRPELALDPDQAASDWQAVLKHTDERAKSVLTPEQQQFWTQLRQFERAVFWSWLPKDDDRTQ
jgi:hypothetical protein